ncbi:hypothetical protein ABT009_31255 [Streptomyces sp. NPDC002896]|uniref:hypothetical protein n=1 Tax=Streptomyces sp. NPDC002896 TaxID=3154438 RepID=UPI00331B0DC9
MARTGLAHGTLTSLAAALALLTAGCSGTADGAERSGAGGCRENGDRTAKEQARWLRQTVSFPGGTTRQGAVALTGSRDAADDVPLCAPVTVRVEFWKLTLTTAGTDVASVQRTRLRTDGRRDHSLSLPPTLSARQRDVCTGVLIAAYVGKPLTEAELPEDIGRAALAGSAEIAFRSDRVAAYELLPPADPGACAAGETATDRPSTTKPPATTTTKPPATSNPWGLYHP